MSFPWKTMYINILINHISLGKKAGLGVMQLPLVQDAFDQCQASPAAMGWGLLCKKGSQVTGLTHMVGRSTFNVVKLSSIYCCLQNSCYKWLQYVTFSLIFTIFILKLLLGMCMTKWPCVVKMQLQVVIIECSIVVNERINCSHKWCASRND